MFGSKVWEEIFGEQILLNGKKSCCFLFFCFFFGGGGGGGGGWEMENNFFLKQIFWRGNFWYQVLEERFL